MKKRNINFHPACLATGIGSLPFIEPEPALKKVFDYLPEIPYWPQLPKRNFREGMSIQFTKNLKFLEIKEQSLRVKDEYLLALEDFFSAIIKKNLDYFEIGDEYALGLKAFLNFVKTKRPALTFLKGQITGPFTLASAVKMPSGESLLFDAQLLDALVSGLAMKAAWQVREFKRLGKSAIIFIDEPYLACFGSAFTAVNRQDVIEIINRLIETIEAPDCLIGLHCCSNTDWSMLLETDIDIISFDAFSYFERFSLYPQELKRFLARGGTVAWGIVPTSEFNPKITLEDLLTKFEAGIASLVQKGLDKSRLIEQSLLSPSCGLGTLSIPDAEAVLKLLAGLSQALRRKFSLS